MKKHKNLLFAIFLLCSTEMATAQDVILKKDNTTILSKVLEITSTEIKYKKWSNQDGPTYSINRSEVTSINYPNGEVERFTEQPNTVLINPNNYSQPIKTQSSSFNSTPIQQTSTPNPKSPYSRGKQVQFSLNGGVAIPVGKFGTTNNNAYCAPFSFFGDELETGCGAAKTGFNASMKFHFPVYIQDKDIVGISIKDNVMFNGFTDNEKRSYRELWQALGNITNEQNGTNAYQYQVTKYSNYINFSIMGGGDYTHYFSKSFGLFAEANIGLNISAITKSELSNLRGETLAYVDYANHIEYYSGDGMEVKYKTKVNFAYEIGGGLFLFDHFSIGLFYTGYSPFQVSPTWREYSSKYSDISGNYEDAVEITAPKLQVSAISIQLGVHF